jgi:hypothetical protein
MTSALCHYDHLDRLTDMPSEDARERVVAVLRCSARQSCRRCLLCSDSAIDLLYRRWNGPGKFA